MQPDLQVTTLPVAALIPYAENARTHSEAQVGQIAASISEFGFVNPVLVDAAGVLVAGHGRVLAAKRLGMAVVPAIRLQHLTEVQARALRIADNKLALNASWDEDLLRLELADLQVLDFNVGLTGFGGEELADLLTPRTAGLTDPDEAPATPAAPVTAPGDIWVLGRHRLTCGDCTDPAVVARVLDGAVPELMVTDPPYGVQYDPSWRNDAARAQGGRVGARALGRVENDDRADWREAWALFPGAVAYVWHAGAFAGVVATALEACRFQVRAQIVWVKQRPVLSRGAYHHQHEPAFYAVRAGEADHWQDPTPDDRFADEHAVAAYAVRAGKTGHWHGDRKQSTVWFIDHLKSDTGHGTQKPVACMARPLLNNSGPGALVYEPFSGSGTTIIAAEMTGRACRALEISPAYVDVAVQRWQQFTGQAAILDGDGRSFAQVATARRAGGGQVTTPPAYPDPPDWLTASQRESWQHAVRNAPTALLPTLDTSMLAAWVVAEDQHRTAAALQGRLPLMPSWHPCRTSRASLMKTVTA